MIEKLKEIVDKVLDPKPVSQHAYETVACGRMSYPASHFQTGKYEPSALDEKLTELKKKGVKVLGFRREGGRWLIKTMAVA